MTQRLRNTGCPVASVNQRVLIVDDDWAIANSLATIFRFNGYVAVAVNTAEDALKLLATWTPGFAIIDVSLPGMNGIDLARALQQSLPLCHAILLTGTALTDPALTSAAASFDVVAKPALPSALLRLAAVHFLSIENNVRFG